MDLPEPARTTFNETVWELVRQIPPGKVASYGQIGTFIPTPAGVDEGQYAVYRARWVGNAMALCPQGVPWQWVINAQGKISPRRGGWENPQRNLLEAEGVVFDTHGRVDMAQYGWSGPPDAWLRERGLIIPPGDTHSQETLF